MIPQVLSILAAAGVLAGSLGGGDTRAASAIPAPRLAMAQPATPVGVSHQAATRHLGQSDQRGPDGRCVHDRALIDATHPLCGGWHMGGAPLAFGLGAAAVGGVIIAVSTSDHNSTSH